MKEIVARISDKTYNKLQDVPDIQNVFVTGPRSPNQHIEQFLKLRDIPLRVVSANDWTTTKLLRRIKNGY